jgi:hypothetical protein
MDLPEAMALRLAVELRLLQVASARPVVLPADMVRPVVRRPVVLVRPVVRRPVVLVRPVERRPVAMVPHPPTRMAVRPVVRVVSVDLLR